MTAFTLHRDVPLRELTTLAVGGPARALLRVRDVAALPRALEVAHEDGRPPVVLGGGSNVIVADRGVDATILQIDDDHLSADLHTGRVRVAGGYDWDALVAWSVEQQLAGMECLSGIPGRTGAAPVQNVGAYGQEIAEVTESVQAVDLRDGSTVELDHADCGFAYRDSHFKRDWAGRYAITELTLRLRPRGEPTVAYAELERRLAGTSAPPDLATVRSVVLDIRRGKSMVIDPADENHRSAGSFFTNPIVDDDTLGTVLDRAGRLDPEATLPRWEIGPGRTKIAAAWLIERSGFGKGHGTGEAGLSTRHVLALVNRGRAKTQDLIDLAREVRNGVLDTFGVRLRPEPVPLGFEPGEVDDLWH